MIVEISETKTYKISKLENIDPVTCYVTNYEKGKGKIVIECWGKTWQTYWGAMGKRDLEEFFISCDKCYIINRISDIPGSIYDYEAISKVIGKYVDEDTDLWTESELMQEHFGCEWFRGYSDIPMKSNPDYEYLSRIVDAVRNGFKQVKNATVVVEVAE